MSYHSQNLFFLLFSIPISSIVSDRVGWEVDVCSCLCLLSISPLYVFLYIVNSTSASEDESVCRRSSDQEGSISSFDRVETRTSQLEDLDEDRMYGAGGLSDLQNPARFGLRKARLRRGGFGNDLVEARNTRLECSDSELDRSRRSLGHIFTGQYRSDREILSGISTDSRFSGTYVSLPLLLIPWDCYPCSFPSQINILIQ